MPTVYEIENALAELTPPPQFHLIQMSENRVRGEIVWEGFQGQPIDERQREIWAKLRRALSAKSTEIGVLILTTPAEHASI